MERFKQWLSRTNTKKRRVIQNMACVADRRTHFRRLAVEHLEERRVLANINVTGVTLIDGQSRPMTEAVVGERIRLRVNFTTTDLAADASYRISFKVNDVPIEFAGIDFGAGLSTGAFFATARGWFAEFVGAQSVNVTVDADNTVVESDELDNTRTFSFGVVTATPPVKLTWPQPGTPFKDFAFTNYVDLDPTPGLRDWAGGRAAYDGHGGLDFGSAINQQMDDGIAIYAAASGTVIEVQDGHYDRNHGSIGNIVPGGPPNYVRIDHGNGWHSIYFHLRRDSIAVKVGDVLERGAFLGFEGSSGESTGSHLHFEVRHNLLEVETFLDPSTYWQDPLPYVLSARYLNAAGVTNYNPVNPVDHLRERPSDVEEFSELTGQTVYAWGIFTGLKANDSLDIVFRRPDGSAFSTHTINIASDASTSRWLAGRTLPSSPTPGVWSVDYRVNDVLLGTKTFLVSPLGAPEARVEEANADIVLDGRYTPFDLGTANIGAVAPTKTFTLVNHGSAPLAISQISVPLGFQVVEGLPGSLAAGASDSFTIGLNTSNTGSYAGQVRIATNDTSEAEYNFSVEGRVGNSPNSLRLGLSQRRAREATSLTGRVYRSGDLSSALTVNLSSSDSQKLTLPATVIIPANEASALFTMATSYDPGTDLTKVVTITASAAGFANAINELDVENLPAGFSVTQSGGTSQVSESGTSDTFTVVLTNQPSSNVTLSVVSEDSSETRVQPSTVTFTPATWNIPRTVNVIGVDDPHTDGNQQTQITVAVVDASSDDLFDLLPDTAFEVTTEDDENTGFLITVSENETLVSEAGTTDTIGVTLSRPPVSDVVLAVQSSDVGEVTANPATLTFTPENWNVSQTVLLTGVDDPLVDNDQLSVLTVSVIDELSEDSFDESLHQTVSVTTKNDDSAGFAVSVTGGSTEVSEAGTADVFSVVLTAQPAANVVIAASVDRIGEITLPTSSLTFTPANWNVPQAISVLGSDDNMVDGDQTSLISIEVVFGSSDPFFSSLPDQTVHVVTTDDDVPGFAVTATDGNTTVSEEATFDNLSVVLTRQPLSDVVITVTSQDTAELVVEQASLTFSPANWSTPQLVPVIGVDDDWVDGLQTTLVQFSVLDDQSNNAFDIVMDQSIPVVTQDNDVAGMTVAVIGEDTIVSEGGTIDTFTVALTGRPQSDVVVSVTSTDTGEATVDQTRLTFTPLNWNLPQAVIVSGVNELIVDGDQITSVAIAVLPGESDDAFDALLDQAISVRTTDDDAAGFTVTAGGGGSRVSEAGTSADIQLVLSSQPLTDVTFVIASSETTEVTVDDAELTFTPANWNVPQTATVRGVDDERVDGSRSSVVSIQIDDQRSDDAFDLVPDRTVTVTNADDDVAGYIVAHSGDDTTVDESGTTDTVTVKLTAQPLSDVRLTIVSQDTTEVTVQPAAMVFTSANWNVVQTAVMTGVDDGIVDGNRTTHILISVDETNSDNAFAGLSDQTLPVGTVDDDISRDYGDAPQADQSGFASSYPTLLVENGARHVTGSLRLGAASDDETDGHPTAEADGDNADGVDEDGVQQIASILAEAGTPTVSSFLVQVSQIGMLDAWIDFNRDGDWGDASEQIMTSQALVAGDNILAFMVPAGAHPGTTYARFRVSSSGGLNPTGEASDGEVEDVKLVVLDRQSQENVDIVSPGAFVELRANEGEMTVGSGQQVLFRAPASSIPHLHMSGTSGDDHLALESIHLLTSLRIDGGAGVDTVLLLGEGQQLSLPTDLENIEIIDIRGSGNNTFALGPSISPSQTILSVLADVGDTVSLGDGWSLAGARLDQGAFFRQLQKGGVTLYLNGPANHQNPLDRHDANGDGKIVPLDALVIINEVNSRRISDTVGKLTDPAQIANFDRVYRDINGDGFLTSIDALIVINQLNARASAAEGEPRVDEFTSIATAGWPSGASAPMVSNNRNDREMVIRESAADVTELDALDALGSNVRYHHVTRDRTIPRDVQPRQVADDVETAGLLRSGLVDEVFSHWSQS